MISPKLIQRVATLKNGDIDKLTHIHIPTYEVLFHLMVWRNRNQDKVRNFKSLVNEGIISVMSPSNFQYFYQDGKQVFHMHKTTEEQYVAFLYDTETWKVTPIANTIEYYPADGAIQDMITVHATVMVYLSEQGVDVVNAKDIIRIDEVKM